ncbi:hypothetical protein FISHEDRAFT_41805 [Fistulina hepatica ATCC 64428]|nr:hypothetical protein FISHEDRAFT_41805 [Fistulina hepatica ATCC 64428]
MSKRTLKDLERKLHTAALKAPKQELSGDDAKEIIPDPKARQDAINFLLSVGLLKSLVDSHNRLSFKAVSKEEFATTKDLSTEENLVLGHIRAAKNEGIWSKHLKTKTNLTQSALDKCIKSLVQKKHIKRVPSVQYPHRKIYMLESLSPSVALTGGPWYTDSELDVEFIQTLMRACLKFIRDLTDPACSSQAQQGALYPVSASRRYPTAKQIRNALAKARLTDTQLSVEHVESLLNVLILDGEIEKIPVGISLPPIDDSDEDESNREAMRKHRRKGSERSSRKRKHSHRDDDSSDSSSDVDSRRRRKRRKHRSRSDDESDSESSDDDRRKRKRRKRGELDNETEDEASGGKQKKKSRKASSDSENPSDKEGNRRERSSEARKIKQRSRSVTPDFDTTFDDEDGVYAYRAVKNVTMSIGWIQAPCSICPSFEFCKAGGPVNAKECVYYSDWLTEGTVAAIEDGS